MPPTSFTMGPETVKILVGRSLTPFTIHKSLIITHSEYFARAFSGRFKKPDENTMELAHIHEATFGLFTRWLYSQASRPINTNPCGNALLLLKSLRKRDEDTNKQDVYDVDSDMSVPIEEGLESDGTESTEDGESESDSDTGEPVTGMVQEEERRAYDRVVDCLIDLYIFADAYETRRLRNDVMSMLLFLDLQGYQYLHNDSHGCIVGSLLYPRFRHVIKAYDNLPDSSSMCRYILHTMAYNWHPDADVPEDVPACELPTYFLAHMMMICVRRQWSEEVTRTLLQDVFDTCLYHEHDSVEEKDACEAQKDDDELYIRSFLLACIAVS
ncbi:hypothetical protein P280DRAFT_94140 [Massarina eburnea CBS 473.64]|uniref:BTB domain-containing protein n=1 Tax=Massarina eburnea CBS 473.64 TaxID=1395130 RepID=A0A6A6RQQ5_9PLEO|nr:hypothetical protein P280DRAFT_94140 [Massarina eburnea CBS 473.64]